MRTRALAIVLALVLTGGLAACNANSLDGVYEDEAGVVSYDFQSDGKVIVTGPFGAGVELSYERDGDRVYIGAGDARQVLTITEEGDLDMGLAVLKKQQD